MPNYTVFSLSPNNPSPLAKSLGVTLLPQKRRERIAELLQFEEAPTSWEALDLLAVELVEVAIDNGLGPEGSSLDLTEFSVFISDLPNYLLPYLYDHMRNQGVPVCVLYEDPQGPYKPTLIDL